MRMPLLLQYLICLLEKEKHKFETNTGGLLLCFESLDDSKREWICVLTPAVLLTTHCPQHGATCAVI